MRELDSKGNAVAFDSLRKVVKGMTGPSVDFNHGAFSPDDVADARRGRPATSLQGFAPSVGLEYRDSELVGAFVSTQPTWPNYVFNACRGIFPGGRYGLIEHELYELGVSERGIDIGGTIYAGKTVFRNNLGGFLGVGDSKPPENAPFVGNYAWLPATAVHVRAPETARLPLLLIFNEARTSKYRNADLASFGLPGYVMVTSDHTPEPMVAAVAQACAPALSSRHDSFLRLRVRHGLVNLTVNGYRSDPADLRQLMSIAEGLAGAFAAMTAPPAPIPFATAGTAAGISGILPGVPRPWPQWTELFAAAATTHGLHDENPAHLLTLLPRNPIPGVPWGVLFGTLPGTSAPVRVVWNNQGGRTEPSCRGGIIAAARPGATTPIGGVLHAPTAMYTEVVDGMAYCWRQQRSFGELEAPLLLQLGVDTLRATGIADI